MRQTFQRKNKMEEERFDLGVNIDIDNSQEPNLDKNESNKIIIKAKTANTKKYNAIMACKYMA